VSEGYDTIADKRIVPMSAEEREYLYYMLDERGSEYQALVVALHREGCEFPKQQAALMLRNTPGAAHRLIAIHRPRPAELPPL
jgi:hypothetical protein